MNTILTELFDALDNTNDCEFKIVGKSEENMGVIDYLNFIFNHILTVEKPMVRMCQNFDLVAPKIGVIYILNIDVYLSRNKKKYPSLRLH